MDILTFILLITIVAVISHFVNRFMNERESERMEMLINKTTASAAPFVAFEEQVKKFDERLNNTWDHISGVKQSLESLKLQIGLKGKT